MPSFIHPSLMKTGSAVARISLFGQRHTPSTTIRILSTTSSPPDDTHESSNTVRKAFSVPKYANKALTSNISQRMRYQAGRQLNLAPRVGKSAEMADEETPAAVLAITEALIKQKNQVGTYGKDIHINFVTPPPEFDFPIARLTNELRPVLDFNGPVSLGPMADDLPYIEPEGFQATITQPADVNWDSIPPFVTASRDQALISLALQHDARYMGSTSSTSPLLSQFHFALTSFAPINSDGLSTWFDSLPKSHTRAATKPSSSLLRRRADSVWGLDNFPSGEPKNNQILIDLGKSLERHLTFSPDQYEKYFVLQRDADGTPIPNPEVGRDLPEHEAHRFMRTGKLFLRSQLDCEDDAVRNDKKVFDLKTRATLPIRLDVGNHADYVSYRITRKTGIYNSFEREYYDMCRSAFLKYSFQCRIGDMGGVFVAYHNTREIFGFEYIPLQRMDAALYGDSDRADFVYRQALVLTEKLMDRLVADNADLSNPRDCMRVTARAYNNRLNVFIERVPDVDVDDPAALDAALACPHMGVVYVDRLTDAQARAALERRGVDSSGSYSAVLARLEGVVSPPDVLYRPRTEEEIRAAVNGGFVKAYVMNLRICTPGNATVQWATLHTPDALRVDWTIKALEDVETSDQIARLYHGALCEYTLKDRMVESDVPNDQLHKILVEGVEVSLTPGQVLKMEERRRNMQAVMVESEKYDTYLAMDEGPEKDAAYASLKANSKGARKR